MGHEEATLNLYLLGEPPPVELMNSLPVDRNGTRHDALPTPAGVDAWVRAVRDRLPTAADDTRPPPP